MKQGLVFACVSVFTTASTGVAAQTVAIVTVRDGRVLEGGEVPGAAGGPVAAATLDPSCRGFVHARPDAVVRVENGAPFVRLFAQPVRDDADLTLLVRAPDGRLACNDDRWGHTPGLDAAMGAGVYHVWVGTFDRGARTRFTLSVTDDPTRRARGVHTPLHDGAARLRPLDEPRGSHGSLDSSTPLTGRAGGGVDARTLAAGCEGWIDPVPDHVLDVASRADFARVFVRSRADTTLVVRRPDGSFACADDTWGENPAVDGAFEPGAYAVWVGSYAPATRSPYQLYFASSRTARP